MFHIRNRMATLALKPSYDLPNPPPPYIYQSLAFPAEKKQ